MAAKEADGGTLFHHFLVAYGGTDIVLPSGKLNIDDAAVQKAAVRALERLTTPYKKGYVPPGAINWGDVDNNNAFFAKQIVMTPNATISIAVAQMEKADQYYKQMITQGIPLGNDSKPVPGILARVAVPDPEGRQEHRCRQGAVEKLHQAGQSERVFEGNPRPVSPRDDVEHQVGPLLAGPRRSAPACRGRQPA